jgi:hypothetical protein
MDDYYIFLKVNVINGRPYILWKICMNSSILNMQLRLISKILSLLNYFFSH